MTVDQPGESSYVRSDVWAAAGHAFDAGLWDDAVFDAFRLLEDHMQRASGVADIGGGLVNSIFDRKTKNSRIRISTNPHDVDNLNELFAGALGFFKGDRSHKRTPAFPCPDATMCVRLLTVASALMDLIDLDLNTAPTITNVHMESNEAIALLVVNSQPDVVVHANDKLLLITSRAADVLSVRVPSEAGVLSLHLQSGSRHGPIYRYEHLPIRYEESAPIQKVAEADVPTFTDKSGRSAKSVRAVCLLSREGSRPLYRYFPTEREYQAGDYVTVEWDHRVGDDQAWVRRHGQQIEAWTSSMTFAGRVVGREGVVRVARIEIKPSRISLRPDHRVPLRVIGIYTDGVAMWREDLTERAVFSIKDNNVAVVPGTFVRGQRNGRTTLTARVDERFAQAEIVVAALASGNLVEFLSGIPRIVSIRQSIHGLLLADQRERILVLRPDLKLDVLTQVDLPDTYAAGLDLIDSDPSGNLYIRTLWDNTIRRLDADRNFSSGPQATIAEGTIMAFCWTPRGGVIIVNNLGQLWSWDGSGQPKPWGRVHLSPIAMASHDDQVLVLGGQTGPGLVAIESDGKTMRNLAPELGFGRDMTALLSHDSKILLAAFREGEIYEVRSRALVKIASGPNDTYSLANDGNGGFFVSALGTDTVWRVLN